MSKVSLVKKAVGSGNEDESKLVEAARSDPAAFGTLYRRYATRVYRYIYSHVGEAADAEDITAQVFTAAWEGIHHYRDQGNFAAWLFRIARNKTNDHYRRKRDHLSIEDTDERLYVDWDPLENLEKAETMQQLAGLINKLEPEYIDLLRLRFAADLSFAEIGQIKGRSEASVKMAVHRLLNRLHADWEKQDD